MSMYMNQNNSHVRPAPRGARGGGADAPAVTVGGAVPSAVLSVAAAATPIEAGKAAEAMAMPVAEGGPQAAAQAADARAKHFCGDPCKRSVAFCETFTLHESFDACGINPDSARIAYDTSLLGYSVESLTMPVMLPCGCQCEVPVQRLTLTGAIPYLLSVGTVSSTCGGEVPVCVQGSAAVDEVVRYICGDEDPEMDDFSCDNVKYCLFVSAEPCGCSDKTNITFCGRFIFQDFVEEA